MKNIVQIQYQNKHIVKNTSTHKNNKNMLIQSLKMYRCTHFISKQKHQDYPKISYNLMSNVTTNEY